MIKGSLLLSAPIVKRFRSQKVPFWRVFEGVLFIVEVFSSATDSVPLNITWRWRRYIARNVSEKFCHDCLPKPARMSLAFVACYILLELRPGAVSCPCRLFPPITFTAESMVRQWLLIQQYTAIMRTVWRQKRYNEDTANNAKIILKSYMWIIQTTENACHSLVHIMIWCRPIIIPLHSL